MKKYSSLNRSLHTSLSLILLFCTSTFLVSCGGSDSTPSSKPSTKGVAVSVPHNLFPLAVDDTSGIIEASIRVDENASIDMRRNGDNFELDTLELDPGEHTVVITFYFTDPDNGVEKATIATYTKTVIIAKGETTSLGIADIDSDTDYETVSFDEDNDGLSNFIELQQGSNLIVANWSIGGSIRGLSNEIFGLQLNEGVITEFTRPNFSFAESLLHNTNYRVAIASQPNGFNCTFVTNNGLSLEGTATDHVGDIDIRCAQIIPDTTPPVITLNGDNAITLLVGDVYTEQGANANDDQDGMLSVTENGNVNTDSAAVYIITYSAADSAGNASSMERTVTVKLPAPFITKWKTDNLGASNDNQIQIGTFGTGYNYRVDWGDGTADTNITGDITHSYAAVGIYTVAISGDFPRIYFSFPGYDEGKLLSVEQWGDQRWQSMGNAFYNCRNLLINATDVPDLSQVTDMSAMFYGAWFFNHDLSSWNVSSVTNMHSMFQDAHAFNQDLSSWDVSSVINMSAMFARALEFNQDLNSWDVSSVTNMEYMFIQATAFNQNLSHWDVSSVIDMENMFFQATAFNQNLSNWDVSSVTDMEYMFFQATAFNQDLSNWEVSSVINMVSMFGFVTLSTSNYDALLVGWSQRSLQNNVVFDAGNSIYSNAALNAREVLTNSFNWTVTDGGSE